MYLCKLLLVIGTSTYCVAFRLGHLGRPKTSPKNFRTTSLLHFADRPYLAKAFRIRVCLGLGGGGQ
jgi:hypothetical protein